ncbi:alpha/beta fold hydrolase [Microbacterium aurum]
MTTGDLDAQLRTAEESLYDEYGLSSREHRVSVPSLSTRVRVVEVDGDDTRPPIVLLHGISSVTALTVPLIPAFGGRRVLAVDFPGHGLSDAYTYPRGRVGPALAEVVAATVDALSGREVDLVAHSLGGQTALTFVLAHPGSVRRLVLLGAPGAAFEGVHPAAAMRLFAVPGVGRAILSLPTSLEAYAKNGEAMLGAHALDGYPLNITRVGWPASRRPGFAPSLASCFRGLLDRHGVRPGVAISPERLAAVTAPTLMLWGDQDVFLKPDAGRASIDAIADSRVVIVPNAGHAPWLNDLPAASREVAAFLDEPVHAAD